MHANYLISEILKLVWSLFVADHEDRDHHMEQLRPQTALATRMVRRGLGGLS